MITSIQLHTHIYIYSTTFILVHCNSIFSYQQNSTIKDCARGICFAKPNCCQANKTKQNKTFIFHYEIEIINNRLLATKDFVPHLNDLRYAYNYRFKCVISKDLYTWFWFRSGPVYVVTHSDLTLNFQSKIQHRQA